MNANLQNLKNKLLMSTVFLILLVFLVIEFFDIVINTSKSMPVGLYTEENGQQFERGDLVILCPPPDAEFTKLAIERSYFSWGLACNSIKPLLKEIVGMPGDSVMIRSDGIYINNELIPNTEAIEQDSKERPLIRASSEVVPDNHFWFISRYSKYSFDSRYYGSIHKEHVLSKVKPLYIVNNLGE